MIDNFFSAGDLIVQRLKNVITAPAVIRIAPNQEWALANVLDRAISVIYWDDQPTSDSAGNGKYQTSEQYWLIVISLKNAQNVGNAARQEVGSLVVDVLQALQGYDLSINHKSLVRRRCPLRNPDKGIYVHVPLMFSTAIHISATK